MTDPAAEAERCRQAAAETQEEAARLAAEAQQRAAEIIAKAEVKIGELTRRAQELAEDAAAWQRDADRDAAIVAAQAEAEVLEAARDRLTAEAASLEETAARLESRLAELMAQHAEAEQHRAMAVRNDDEAALRAAAMDLVTTAELAQGRQAELAAARGHLARVRGELDETGQAIGRTGVRLVALRREAAGLPPLDEAVAVTMGLLPALVASMMAAEPERLNTLLLAAVPEERCPAMAEAIRLGPADPKGMVRLATMAAGTVLGGRVRAALEQLAVSDPAQYEAIRRMAFAEPPAPEPAPSPEDVLSGRGLAELGDGWWRSETPPRGR